jgi:hypothetical protein
MVSLKEDGLPLLLPDPPSLAFVRDLKHAAICLFDQKTNRITAVNVALEQSSRSDPMARSSIRPPVSR